LTEHGFVRIRANPNYHPANRRSVADMIEALKTFASSSDHEFEPAPFSLRGPSRLSPSLVVGSRQITALYLLALAVEHHARLVTFDEGVHLAAIPDAQPENLLVI
jgi:uncharacterized protein